MGLPLPSCGKISNDNGNVRRHYSRLKLPVRKQPRPFQYPRAGDGNGEPFFAATKFLYLGIEQCEEAAIAIEVSSISLDILLVAPYIIEKGA